MKKLLFAFGLIGILTTAVAQNHVSQNMLLCNALCVTNGIGFTNFSFYGTSGSNQVGLVFTNLSATKTVVSSTSASKTPLTRDVVLFPDRAGGYPPLTWITDTNGTSIGTHAWQKSPLSMFIRVVGGSGANTATSFRFAPVCDGVNPSTAAGDIWTVAVTPSGATPVTVITNVPLYKWNGCIALRVMDITAGDTDPASRVDVIALSVNGWQP
jgi:hypothetical protein